MGEQLAGARLSEAVVSALRLASSRRQPGAQLSTADILTALVSNDVTGQWSRFLLDDRRREDPTPASDDTWERVPLSGEAAAALARARRISEAYDLVPMPTGVLAIAAAWEPRSSAAQAFVGIAHDELLGELQSELLGTELEGLARLDDPPGRGLDDPPELSERYVVNSMWHVVPLLPAWLARLLVLAALVGIYFSVTTSPAWQFIAEDDLVPPIDRPTLAVSIPTTSELESMLDMELVRDHDGLPRLRTFDSVLPFFWDVRHEVIDAAWAGHWTGADGRSEVIVEVVTTLEDYDDREGLGTTYTDDCTPAENDAPTGLVGHSGFESQDKDFALYCSVCRSGQTAIFIGVANYEASRISSLPRRVVQVRTAIEQALPLPPAELKDKVSTPYSTAQIRRSLLSLILLIPLVWLLPTLLFDRATWQRFRWTALLRRFASSPFPGFDIDPIVRARLWGSALVACVQALVVIWVMRVSWTWTPFGKFVGQVADGMGWNVAGALDTVLAVGCALGVGMVPRLIHGRRGGRSQAFVGGRRLLWASGALVGLGTLVVAYFLLSLGLAASAFGTGGGSDFGQQRFAALLRLAAIPLLLLALAPMTLMRRIAMRALRTRQADDEPPPILLLRSFTDDGIKVRARGNQRRSLIDRLSLRRWERFEEVIAAALSAQGPVLGVGQVGERLPPALGAVRRQFTNEEWQERVGELVTEAQLICVTLGRTESLAWEIGRISAWGLLPKTIFVLPPTTRAEHLKRLAALANLLDLNWVDLNPTVSAGWVVAVRVEAKGARPFVIRARAQEDVAYDVALEMMRLSVLGWTWPTPSLDEDVQVAPPPKEIHARGLAPVKKSLWRRPYLMIWMINVLGLVSLPFVFLLGEEQGTSVVLDLGESRAYDVAADPASDKMYALVDGVAIFELHVDEDADPLELTGDHLADVDVAESLVVHGGWAYAFNPIEGTVQAVSTESGMLEWKRDDLQGVRSLDTSDDVVYAALPSEHKVVALDRSTGDQVAEQAVDGVPWSLAVHGDELAVALATTETVARFELGTLDPLGSYSVTASTELIADNGDLYSYSPEEHALTVVAGPNAGSQIMTRSEDPAFATNDRVLAIGGVEIVSTVWPSGDLFRNRYLLRHPTQLAVTGSGDVLAATDNSLVFIRASLRGEDP